jgi:hypothetical protein
MSDQENTTVETNIDGIEQAPAVVMPAGCNGVEMKFNFKARNLYDEAGKVVGKSKKQPSLVVMLPVPTHETVATFLADVNSKESGLIMSAVTDLVYAAARNQFDEMIDSFENDDSRTVAASMLDLSKLDLTYIANLPPTSRASSVPGEEEFKSFFTDYLAVMPAATGKALAAIERHIKLFTKPTAIKANKQVLEVLVGQLDLYMATTQAIEDTGGTANYIRTKLDRWFNEPEKAIDLSLL